MLIFALLLGQMDLFPYEGRPIVSVDVTGPEGENVDLVRSLLDIQPGYLFASADVSRGVRRIFALGRFSDVAVSVTPVGTVVSLEVRVETQAIVGELTFSGETDPEVTRELRGVFSPAQPLDDGLTVQLIKRVEKLWEGIGYPQAQCEVKRAPPRRQTVDLEVSCRKGPGAYVKRVEFVGRPKARDYQLTHELSVVAGSLYAERHLKDDEKALRVAYYKRGFLQAQTKVEAFKESEGVVLRYTIDAGPRVALRLSGNRRFTDKDLLALAKRDADEPMSASVLARWKGSVTDKYVQHGFSYAKAEVKSYTDPGQDVVYHVLYVDEGKRYHVETIEFPGAAYFKSERLRDEVVAFVNQRLDPSLFSGEVNPNAVRALEDSTPGIKNAPRVRPPAFDHWLYRIDPEALYEPEAYGQAEDAIRRLYLEQGFTRVEVGPIAVERDDESGTLRVRLPVREGPRALVTALIFSGSQALEVGEMLDLAKLQADQPFSELAVEETRAAVQKSLASRGFLYARVEPSIDFDPTLTQASVRFSVSDGPQVFVSRVLIQGNDNTHEATIRDRVFLEPDKPYSPDLAQQTKDEVQRLEVFDSTNVGLADPDVPAEQKDVLVRLLERKTQSFDFGVGISTAQGIRGFVEYNEKNFLNRAQHITLRVQLSRQLFFSPIFIPRYADVMADRFENEFTFNRNEAGERYFDPNRFFLQSIERLIRASWRTPRALKLPGRPQFYVEASNERLNTLLFSLDSTSLLLGLDLTPVNRLRAVLETSIAYNGLRCFDPGGEAEENSCDIRNLGRTTFVAEGQFLNWKTGPAIFLDFRDNPLNARSGFLGVLRTDLVVGTKTDDNQPQPIDPRYSFLKAELQLTGYIPVAKKSSFALAGRVGNIFRVSGDEALIRTQLNELFFLGGRNTLRGFYEQAVLPQDACVVLPNAPSSACARPENRREYDPAGTKAPPLSPGLFYYVLKGEYRFPVLGDLMGSVFVDAGNLYFQASNFQPLAILVNVGAGVRYQTPVGSLAVDLGFNPVPRAERGEVVVGYPYIYVGLF